MSLTKSIIVNLFPCLLIIFAITACNKKEQCSIQDISGVELLVNNDIIADLDTIKNNLSLLVYFDLSCKKIKNSELLNKLDYKTTRIEFDKAFILHGETIEPGTNLANLKYENLIKGQHTEPIEAYTIKYEFYEEFFLSSEFDSTLYQITFEIKSSEGNTLKTSRNQFFR